MASNTIELFTDKDIERLEKIKELVKEIKEIDNNFSTSNILDINEETILIVTTNKSYSKHNIDFIEEDLRRRIGVRCVLIPEGTKIEKAINIKRNNKQEIDYETKTFDNEYETSIKGEDYLIKYNNDIDLVPLFMCINRVINEINVAGITKDGKFEIYNKSRLKMVDEDLY